MMKGMIRHDEDNPEMMKENHAKMMGMMKENPEMMKSMMQEMRITRNDERNDERHDGKS
jgi:hypothetical protein